MVKNKKPKYNPVSLATAHLSIFFEGSSQASASGYLINRDGVLYLVTALHCLTGHNPYTNKPLPGCNGTPDYVCFVILTHDYFGKNDSSPLFKKLVWRFRLYDDGVPRWYVHPEYGNGFDVAVLEIAPAEILENFKGRKNQLYLPEDIGSDNIEFIAGNDCLIVGYPFDLEYFPILKRGFFCIGTFVRG